MHIYTLPWMRIGPYMTGAASGFILHRSSKIAPSHLVIPSRFRRRFWITITLLFLLTLFMTYERRFLFGTLFNLTVAFGRLVSGALIGSIICACALQAGGWLDRVLSWRPFVHFNRLTYLVYLLNPVVLVILRSASESSAHFDIPEIVKH